MTPTRRVPPAARRHLLPAPLRLGAQPSCAPPCVRDRRCLQAGCEGAARDAPPAFLRHGQPPPGRSGRGDVVSETAGAGGGGVSAGVSHLWRRHPAGRVHDRARGDPFSFLRFAFRRRRPYEFLGRGGWFTTSPPRQIGSVRQSVGAGRRRPAPINRSEDRMFAVVARTAPATGAILLRSRAARVTHTLLFIAALAVSPGVCGA